MVPKNVLPICTKENEAGLCMICPVFPKREDELKFTITRERPEILGRVGSSTEGLKQKMMKAIGIPPCKIVNFKIEDYYSVEDARLVAKLEIDVRENNNNTIQPALCIGNGIEGNVNYEMIGRVFPDPKTQQSLILIIHWVPTSDALSNYRPSNEELEKLTLFQPSEWPVEGIEKKLDNIYEDFEANVTRIFEPRDLHLAVDLAFHSALIINIDNQSDFISVYGSQHVYRTIQPSSVTITDDCTGCRHCTTQFECPALLYDEAGGRVVIDGLLCTGCGVCIDVCPLGAIRAEVGQGGDGA